MLELEAPAKVNLSLEVICRRPDGYHEVRSILASVSLADRLTFRESPVLKLHCDLPSWSAEKSLVRRAVHLVGEATGKQSGVEITLKKRIPLRAGLGGDSSDAAAVLRGLNRLWGLRLDGEKLKHVPKTATNRNFAYNNAHTYFDKEYVMLLSDIDSVWHCLLYT
ncbi:MAG: hypothetical protein N2506_02130, partial [Dehalococcoidales bacterium]|nr:hypothetical protein [Dehalococcoidales bacterium]